MLACDWMTTCLSFVNTKQCSILTVYICRFTFFFCFHFSKPCRYAGVLNAKDGREAAWDWKLHAPIIFPVYILHGSEGGGGEVCSNKPSQNMSSSTGSLQKAHTQKFCKKREVEETNWLRDIMKNYITGLSDMNVMVLMLCHLAISILTLNDLAEDTTSIFT